MTSLRSLARHPDLTEAEQAALQAGDHEAAARSLESRGRPGLAARIYEALWIFDRAVDCHLRAGDPVGALETALLADDPRLLGRVVEAAAQAEPEVQAELARRLRAVGRHEEAARLSDRDPAARVRDLAAAGEPRAAVQVALDHGDPRLALEVLGSLPPPDRERFAGLAARARWAAGDVEGAVRAAQQAVVGGDDDDELRALLAAGLSALGYPTAAALVVARRPSPGGTMSPPPRFEVTFPLRPRYVGAAYAAVDRLTLEEVEVHLLLADVPADAEAARAAVEGFARRATSAGELGHPALTPVRFVDPDAGLLVVPRMGPCPLDPAGPPLPRPAIRGFAAFLAGGLAAGHREGHVCGAVFPSYMGRDPLGRPLLPPFGTYALLPLAGTRSTGLEELLRLTAPEVRRGHPPGAAADVYALAALYLACLAGSYGALDLASLDLPPEERDVLARALAKKPEARPTADDLARALARGEPVPPSAVVRQARSPEDEAPSESGAAPGPWVLAAASWPDGILDEICATPDPWVQPVVDRRGRHLRLLGWPPGARVLGTPETPAPDSALPEEALDAYTPEAADAIRARLRASSLVQVPSGDVVVALDDVLTR